MTEARQAVVDKLWAGEEPFTGIKSTSDIVDYQGWASENPMLIRSLDEVKPTIVLDIGVWKGGIHNCGRASSGQ